MDKITVLDNGFCECMYEPRGDCGLEGYQLNTTYPYERKQNITTGEMYYKVFPINFLDKSDRTYGETCSKKQFNKYFRITQFSRIEGSK